MQVNKQSGPDEDLYIYLKCIIKVFEWQVPCKFP